MSRQSTLSYFLSSFLDIVTHIVDTPHVRDDIHKRVAVPQQWQRLVKCTVTPAERGEQTNYQLKRNVLGEFNRQLGVSSVRRIEDEVIKHQAGLFRAMPMNTNPEAMGLPCTTVIRRLIERVCLGAPNAQNARELVEQEAKNTLTEHVHSYVREAISTVSVQKGTNVNETLSELNRISACFQRFVDEVVTRRLAGEKSNDIAPSSPVDPDEDLLG